MSCEAHRDGDGRTQDAPTLSGRTTSRPGRGRAHAPFLPPCATRPGRAILSAFFGVEPDGKSNTRTANPKKQLAPCAIGLPFAGMFDPVTQGVLWKSNTMKTKERKTTAAKAATNDGGAQGAATKGNGTWRTTTRKGERVLIDPHGNAYHGTAQEIREAALTPTSRRSLANSIAFVRYTAAHFNYTPEEMREYVREKRRDAIRTDNQFALFGESVQIPADVYILLRAGARLVRDNFDEYLAELFRDELDALVDIAQEQTGRREIPLTRYERAALERIRATRPQIEAEAKARLATA